jgi:hypothetical protein
MAADVKRLKYAPYKPHIINFLAAEQRPAMARGETVGQLAIPLPPGAGEKLSINDSATWLKIHAMRQRY